MPFPAWRVLAVTVGLVLPAATGLAQTKATVLKTESILELDFGPDKTGEPYGVREIKSVERRLLVIPGAKVADTVGARQAVMVLEAEIRREEELDAKGIDGTVTITAWQYGPEPARKKLYTIGIPGMGMHVDWPFVVTEEFSDNGGGPWRHFFYLHDGSPAFEGYRAAPRAIFAGIGGKPDERIFRIAGFTPWHDEMPRRDDISGGIIGLLTYMDHSHVLARALLVHQDREAGRMLASMPEENHKLDFVDLGRRTDPDGERMQTPIWGQTLRLRFRSSNFDLFIPVKENDFLIDDPSQGLPPGFKLIPYALAKP